MKSERIVAFNDEIWKDIKRYQKLCEFYNLYLQIRYYGDGDVCFSGINENDDEIFMVSIRYYKNERRFYIGLNSQLEKYRNNGTFRKEEILLLLSLDDLTDKGELEYRELTAEETWKLQGYHLSQYDRVKETGISDTDMYKLAGNSICVPVLEAIFKELLIDKKSTSNKYLIKPKVEQLNIFNEYEIIEDFKEINKI